MLQLICFFSLSFSFFFSVGSWVLFWFSFVHFPHETSAIMSLISFNICLTSLTLIKAHWWQYEMWLVWFLSFFVSTICALFWLSSPIPGTSLWHASISSFLPEEVRPCQKHVLRLWVWRAATRLTWLADLMHVFVRHVNEEIRIGVWELCDNF